MLVSVVPAGDHLNGKPGPGRPPGAPNRRTKVARERALELLEHPDYKLSLLRRIQTDTLAPLMERSLWEYAYGPPKQRVEISTRQDYSELSHEELAQKALDIRQQLLEEAERERQMQEEAARTSATSALLMAQNGSDTVQ